jgi:hypothetical protein
MGIGATIAAIGSTALEAIGIGGTAAAGAAGAAGAAAGAAATGGLFAAGAGAATGIAATAAATAPSWLAMAGTASQALGGVVGGIGALEQGQAAASAAKYNAAVAAANAKVAGRNAAIAGMSGSAQAAMSSQKTRAMVGALAANEAAGNIDVNRGSAVDTRASAQSLGELDALTIRSNAAREAYGYQTQQASLEAESNLSRVQASNDLTAGYISGASTFLGSESSAALNYAKYQQAGGLYG